MSNGVNFSGQPTVIGSAAPKQQAGAPTAGRPAAPTNPYQTDQYGQGRPATGSVPLSIVANDYRRPVDYNALRMQNRLASLGITSTADLLSRANTPAKRNFIAMTIAAMDGQLNKATVNQYLNAWIGVADLSRTGMPLDGVRMLQASGIHDSVSLSRYWSAGDKLALYSTMTSNAVRFGYRMPTWNEFSQAVDAARTMPMTVRW